MPEPLYEPSLLPVGPELGVSGHPRVKANDAVLRQHGFTPQAAHVVQAGSHQHVRHRASA